MTPEERAAEIVAQHWHLLQGTRAKAKAALTAEIAAELNAGQMDQAVTHAKAALEECIDLRAEVDRLRALVKELADDLEAEVEGRYRDTKDYPSELRRYERDMDSVRRARAALAGEDPKPCEPMRC